MSPDPQRELPLVSAGALHERMPRACFAVFEAMAKLGGWNTLEAIATKAGVSQNTASTRISENQRRYGVAYQKRRCNRGYEYRLGTVQEQAAA